MSVSVHFSADGVSEVLAFPAGDPDMGALWSITVAPGVRLCGQMPAAVALRDALNDAIAQGEQIAGGAS